MGWEWVGWVMTIRRQGVTRFWRMFLCPFFSSLFACDAPDTTLSSVSSRLVSSRLLCVKGVYDMIMKGLGHAEWNVLLF